MSDEHEDENDDATDRSTPTLDPDDDPPELEASEDAPPEIAAGDDPPSDPGDDETPALPGETEDGRSGPLGELANRVDEQRGVDRTGDDEFGDLFEEYGDATVDSDALWEQVGSDDPFDVEADDVDEPERRVVDKAKYCQGCRFFSEPPDVACTHQETEILEVLDMDHFEVFNCPIVREDENLENL